MSISVSQSGSFPVVLTPVPEGGFTVRVPAFREIVTFGDDEAEVLAMAREAVELSIEHRLATGVKVPDGDRTFLRSISIPLPSTA